MVELATISAYAVPDGALLGETGLETVIGQYTTRNITEGRVLPAQYITEQAPQVHCRDRYTIADNSHIYGNGNQYAYINTNTTANNSDVYGNSDARTHTPTPVATFTPTP